MSKGDTFENDLQRLIYNATPIAGLADNAASAALSNIFVAAHVADPGEAGTQATSEIAYTPYARAQVARSTGGWAVTGNSTSPVSNIDWPAMTGGAGGTITHFSTGAAVSGASKIFHSGPISPTILVANGVTPRLTPATTITED
jgi:hypothetical protein